MNKLFIFFWLLSSLLLASCGSSNPSPTQASTPTWTSPTPEQMLTSTTAPTAAPSATQTTTPMPKPLPTQTISPSSTPTFSGTLPILLGDALPWPAQVINRQTASQLTLLASWKYFMSSHITSLAFSPQGNLVAVGLLTGEIKILDAADGSVLRTFTGHSDMVTSLDFSPDGTRLASGAEDATARVWDMNTGAELYRMPGIDDIGWGCAGKPSVDFSPDGKLLAYAGDDGQVKLWDAVQHLELDPLGESTETYYGSIAALAFSPDGQILAAGFTNNGFCGEHIPNTIILWDPFTRQVIHRLRVDNDPFVPNVSSLAFSPDGKLLAVGFHPIPDEDPVSGQPVLSIALLDGRDSSELIRIPGQLYNEIKSLAFSKDGELFALVNETDPIALLDSTSGEVLGTLPLPAEVLAMSPDGKVLLSGHADGIIRVWGMAP